MEIWLALAARLPLSDFWALLACGDQLLIRKLRSNALITSLNINHNNVALFLSAVKHIKLDKLSSLSVSVSAHIVLTLPSIVSRMPFLTRFDWTAERLDGDSMWELPLRKEDNSIQDVDIASIMPALEHFGFYFLRATAYAYSGRIKFILPESLTSLIFEVPVPHLNLHSPIFNMPPNLTRLYCHGLDLLSTQNLSVNLPRSLTALGGSIPSSGSTTWPPPNGWPDDWRRLSDEVHPELPLEMEAIDWLCCGRLRDLVNCEEPVWSDYVPPEHNSHLPALMEFHKNRFAGWGALRYLPNLVELSVSSYSDRHEVGVPIDTIYLPPTITSLDARNEVFIGERTIWMPPSITSFTSPDRNALRGARNNQVQLYRFEDPDIKLEAPPPHKLDLAKQLNYSLGNVRLHSAFAKELPHYLTKLAVWADFKLEDIGLLPKSLTFMELKSLRGSYTVINSTVLELTKSYSGLVFRESGIPLSQIADPALDLIYDVKFSNEATASSLPPFWPPGLAQLYMSQCSPLLIDTLPKSLTHYTFGNITVTDGFLKRIGDASPWLLRSVSNADLEFAVKKHFDSREGRDIESVSLKFSALNSFPHLRAHTEKLTLDCWSKLHASDFAGFTKLRKLTTAKKQSIQDATLLFDYLPPTIKSVEIDCLDSQMNDSILSRVPEDIHKLRMRHMPMTLATVATTFVSGEYGDELNEATLEAGFVDVIDAFFGRVLAKETPLKLLATPPSSLHFPTTITSIDLPTDIGDPIFYSVLPASLTNLRIVKAFGLFDSALASLPSALLHLEFCEDNALTDEFVSHLPMLRTLKLPRNSKITSSALSKLPTSLETLNLHVATYINDTGISTLPVMITDLDISWSTISPEGLSMLPRGITALDVENCESLDFADPSQLPPSLITLRAPVKLLARCTSDILPLLSTSAVPTEQGMTGLFDF